MTAHAPWHLSGEALACLVRTPADVPPLPQGLERVPGPSLVVGVSYSGSPVGPYRELAVGQPARLGTRPGWCITTMVVDSAESRADGRLNWGYPKELGSLTWRSEGDHRELAWAEGGLTVSGRSTRARLPFLVPVRSLQRRADGPVTVPGRLWGRACLTSVAIAGGHERGLEWLAGTHAGGHVAGMRLLIHPARRPFGWASSLRAPRLSAEPALLLQRPTD